MTNSLQTLWRAAEAENFHAKPFIALAAIPKIYHKIYSPPIYDRGLILAEIKNLSILTNFCFWFTKLSQSTCKYWYIYICIIHWYENYNFCMEYNKYKFMNCYHMIFYMYMYICFYCVLIIVILIIYMYLCVNVIFQCISEYVFNLNNVNDFCGQVLFLLTYNQSFFIF